MKKAFFLLTTALALTSAHAKTVTFDDQLPVVRWDQLSLEKIEELIERDDSDIVVELNQGATIPFEWVVKTERISLILDPNLRIEVNKTCYLRIVNGKGYVSDDLINWEKLSSYTGSSARLLPNGNHSGFIVETTLSPSEDDEDEWEDNDCDDEENR